MKYLLGIYYALGTVLDTGDTVVNKIDEIPVLCCFRFRMRDKLKNLCTIVSGGNQCYEIK